MEGVDGAKLSGEIKTDALGGVKEAGRFRAIAMGRSKTVNNEWITRNKTTT